jgi:Fe-S cluster assembly protein SufD
MMTSTATSTLLKDAVMATQPLALHPFEASIHQLAETLLQTTPPLQSVRQQALGQFKALRLPSRKYQESWKFEQLNPLFNAPLLPLLAQAQPQQAPSTLRRIYSSEEGLFGTCVNGHWQLAQSSPYLRQWHQLETGQQAQFTQQLQQTLTHQTDNMALVNQALATDCVVIAVPANQTLAQPIELFIANTESVSAFPNLLVSLGANAKATLIIRFKGEKTTVPTYLQSMLQAHLAPNAHLDLIILANTSQHTTQLTNTALYLAEQANCNLFTLTLAGKLVRQAITAYLQGEQANVTLNGVSVLKHQTQAHTHISVHHEHPKTNSSQRFKNLVADQALSEFEGTINVHAVAQQTDAQQLCQTLLVSPTAKTLTRPWLTINADDVKCSHGATVGQLDETQLFYLQSRGISPQRAKALLMVAFVCDQLSLIAHLPQLATYIHAQLEASLMAIKHQ